MPHRQWFEARQRRPVRRRRARTFAARRPRPVAGACRRQARAGARCQGAGPGRRGGPGMGVRRPRPDENTPNAGKPWVARWKPFARDTPPHRCWKDVVAGLLALGSLRLASLPGARPVAWWARSSPITAAGAAPEWRPGAFTGFPFDPLREPTTRRNLTARVCRYQCEADKLWCFVMFEKPDVVLA